MLSRLAREARAHGYCRPGAAVLPPQEHVRGSPDEIRNPLEAEHRVVNEKRKGVDPVRSISRARGDARGHGTRLGDAFFKNLAVLRLLVVEERIYIDRFILLADAGINAGSAEKRFHA